MSDSLRPHGLQHARHPCPSPRHMISELKNLVDVNPIFSRLQNFLAQIIFFFLAQINQIIQGHFFISCKECPFLFHLANFKDQLKYHLS